jgi:hypothetical protein
MKTKTRRYLQMALSFWVQHKAADHREALEKELSGDKSDSHRDHDLARSIHFGWSYTPFWLAPSPFLRFSSPDGWMDTHTGLWHGLWMGRTTGCGRRSRRRLLCEQLPARGGGHGAGGL